MLWHVFVGGFTEFHQEFPHLCTGTPSPSEEPTIIGLRNLNLRDFSACPEKQPSPPHANSTVFPVEVLPYLYLGNAQNSEDMDCLTSHGIKYIVNVTPNVQNKFEDSSEIKYLQIPIDDHWSQAIAPFFQKAIAFIGELLFFVIDITLFFQKAVAFICELQLVTGHSTILSESHSFHRRVSTAYRA